MVGLLRRPQNWCATPEVSGTLDMEDLLCVSLTSTSQRKLPPGHPESIVHFGAYRCLPALLSSFYLLTFCSHFHQKAGRETAGSRGSVLGVSPFCLSSLLPYEGLVILGRWEVRSSSCQHRIEGKGESTRHDSAVQCHPNQFYS